MVRWLSGGKHFKIDQLGALEVLVVVVYMIHVVLRHKRATTTTARSSAGNQSMGTCYDSGSNCYYTLSPLMVILGLKVHEKLSVVNQGHGDEIRSYLTVF